MEHSDVCGKEHAEKDDDMSEDKYSRFLQLFMPAQLALRRFVMAHIPDFHQAEDVLQEISLTLWKKFDDYDEKFQFEAWAFGIARNRIMASKRDYARKREVITDEISEKIAQKLAGLAHDESRYLKHVESCIDKMPETQRSVVRMKYFEESSIERIATAVGRTNMAVRGLLCRVRDALAECMRNAANLEEDARNLP
jgi:RNA polymerase sigma-70 factor, ECF subfamily